MMGSNDSSGATVGRTGDLLTSKMSGFIGSAPSGLPDGFGCPCFPKKNFSGLVTRGTDDSIDKWPKSSSHSESKSLNYLGNIEFSLI